MTQGLSGRTRRRRSPIRIIHPRARPNPGADHGSQRSPQDVRPRQHRNGPPPAGRRAVRLHRRRHPGAVHPKTAVRSAAAGRRPRQASQIAPIAAWIASSSTHSRMVVHCADDLADGTCSLHCSAISLSLNIDRDPKALWVRRQRRRGATQAAGRGRQGELPGRQAAGVMTARSKGHAYGNADARPRPRRPPNDGNHKQATRRCWRLHRHVGRRRARLSRIAPSVGADDGATEQVMKTLLASSSRPGRAPSRARPGSNLFRLPKPGAKDLCPVCGMLVSKYPTGWRRSSKDGHALLLRRRQGPVQVLA